MLRILLPILLFLHTVNHSNAQWVLDPVNPTPVTNASCSQGDVSQVSDGQGGTFVFWLDQRSDCGGNPSTDIYGQHYNADGEALWEVNGREIVNDTAKIWGYSSALGPNGGAMLTWFTSQSAITGRVKARRVDNNGYAVWPSDLVLLQTDGCVGNYVLGTSNVQLLPVGNVFAARINVTYCGGSNGNRISRFDQNGNLLNGLNGTPEGNQYYNGNAGIDLTYDGSDDIYLFYTNGNGAGAHASAMRVGAAGDSVFAPVDVLAGTNGLNYQFWGLSDESGLAICYISFGSSESYNDIFLRKLNPDGTWAWGGSITTVCGANGNQDAFDIQQDENYYYICWADGRSGVTPNYALYAQKIDKATGAIMWTTDGVVVQDAGSYLPRPRIHVLDDGSILVFHEASFPYYFNASYVLADGTLGWPEPSVMSNTLPFYEDYSVLKSNGNVIVAWSRAAGSGGTDDIFITRVMNTNTVNLTNDVTACDSYTSNGETFLTSGTFIQEIGDTVLTLNLTINYSYQTSIDATSCFEYTYEGNTYTASGVYILPGTTMAGCDSTTTLNVTIDEVNTAVTVNGTTLTSEATNSEYSWINCLDNTPLGVYDQSFNAMENGQYAVSVTTGECTAISSCYTVVVDHVQYESASNALEIYPNPGNDFIRIMTSQLYSGETVQLFDATGSLVLVEQINQENNVTLNTSSLPRGIYRIVLLNNQTNISATWIKN